MVRAADPKGRCEVLEILDKAKALGLTVLRTWAFSDGPLQWNALQRQPGVYDENTFAALDFVIHQASIRGARAPSSANPRFLFFGSANARKPAAIVYACAAQKKLSAGSRAPAIDTSRRRSP